MNMLRRTGSGFSLAVLLVTLPACGSMSVGQKIESASVSKIVKGSTTRDELISLFGQPYQTVMLPDGGRTLYYIYHRASVGSGFKPIGQILSGKKASAATNPNLSVILDKQGIVTDFEYTPGS
jgi:outer membrane protein assembly factor BamE (lipoprotein component of BamABCDE complex)